jgi:hypothetical protein
MTFNIWLGGDVGNRVLSRSTFWVVRRDASATVSAPATRARTRRGVTSCGS